MNSARFLIRPLRTAGFLSQTFRATRLGDLRSSVLKVGSENPLARKFAGKLRAFDRECAAYELLRPLQGKLVPHCHTSTSVSRGSDGLILLEEITLSRTVAQSRGLSWAELTTTAKSIATIHARFWESPMRAKTKQLPRHHYMLAHEVRSHLREFLRICSSVLTQADRQMIVQLPGRIDRALRAARNQPVTLIHGDLRADNLLFTGSRTRPRVFFIDWQLAGWGLPAFDLARLAAGSSSHPLPRSDQYKLVQIWHQSLSLSGVRRYPIEDAWQDYQTAMILVLSIPITNAAILTRLSTRGRKLVHLMIRRFFKNAGFLWCQS
ncbi:MAG: phosphotransferase [Verrucomicrobia bacterium]|nr:phosphotransferase [Verrucomicrobiota bacterium]